MRTALSFLLLFVASALSAATVRFDPPDPTSATPIVAHVLVPGTYCTPDGYDVERHGSIISITLRITPCARPPLPGFFDYAVNLGTVPAGSHDVVVGLGQILLGIAEGTLTVRNPSPQFTVEPNAGREGDTVTLRGVSNCTTVITTPVCAAVSVTFGDTPATVVSNGTAIVVRVPHLPHSGAFDVFVSGNAAISAFDDITDGTLDPAFFTPVLVPVFFSGPGALGSQWRTELDYANENGFAVVSDSNVFTPQCVVTTCPPYSGPTTAVVFGQNESEGKLIYAARQAMPRLFLDARVRDLSREAQDLGAALPVVREKNFLSGTFDLLNVPTDARSRVALRAYRIDGGTTVTMTIRSMSDPNRVTLAGAALTLHPVGTMQAVTIPDLIATYPQLAGKGPLVITIEGGQSPSTTWAFVSVTNNDTQRVTMIAPQ